MRRLLVVLLASLLAGCGTGPAPSSLVPGDMALATSEDTAACAGIGIDARLHGSASDPHLAWLINDIGARIEILWPAGYRARFTPRLEVLDESGAVLLREGDQITGGCVTADPGTLLLEPPFERGSSSAPDQPPSGLSEDQAVAAARKAFPFDSVLSVTSGRLGQFQPDQRIDPPDRLVWAVSVIGRFQSSCGPALYPGWTPRACPSPATRATVYVDYLTGEFVMAEAIGGG